MLAASAHPWKVNFCKFTNETRNGIEDATAHSGQTYLAALNGTASGGGYELALACDQILLVDDRSSVVSLPELPLLGVLPGHRRPHPGGGQAARAPRPGRLLLHQVRGYRREEGGRVEAGRRGGAAGAMAGSSGRTGAGSARPPARLPGGAAIELTPLDKTRTDDAVSYPHVSAALDRDRAVAEITVTGPAPTTRPRRWTARTRRARRSGPSRSPASSTT